jgi:hypothetical protein
MKAVSMKSHVRGGGGETGTGVVAFSKFDMSTFYDNFAAKVDLTST